MNISLYAFITILSISLLPNASGFTTPANARPAFSTSTSKLMSSATSTELENPRKVGLAFQLDDGTRKSHSIAQNSSFVTGFFKGLSNREAYSKLLTSLYFVYVAMEESFVNTDEDMVKMMDVKELRRVDALREDMDYFYGTAWENEIQPSKAAKKYADRVIEIAKDKPRLLIAHQYTRYLGDLFGGQMMGSMAIKSLDLNEEKGTAFYTFNDIDNTTDFITMWYRKLNSLDLTEQEKEEIVDEANYVFALNIEILEELEGSAMKAALTVAWETFREKMGLA